MKNASLPQNTLWMAVAGLATGWLIGLSVSPVAASVVAALLALICALAAALSGIELKQDAEAQSEEHAGNKSKSKRPSPLPSVKALPIAALAIAIALGASVGVRAREGGWLAPAPAVATTADATIAQWSKLGIPSADVVRRLFDIEFPPPATVRVDHVVAEDVPQPSAGLNAQALEAMCAELRTEHEVGNIKNIIVARGGFPRRLAEKLPMDQMPTLVSAICPEG